MSRVILVRFPTIIPFVPFILFLRIELVWRNRKLIPILTIVRRLEEDIY